ncbi:nickel and cobalt resistance protein cnrR precursor [Novosphingobium sp. Rr 2-17]|uniref:periplasmic heavy metal sensor n=1 Tax=Novosphingobium sp. Rr 2-17 TaxID=555793 RepID=UPI000269817A|nr:periplasmic heavy metal sensor [Novosphingobium sp. Rr 2-17]EIZ81250.1 nickel and cobalt resistance protein cnrR precursor [Novosphingobium sp. Rr 2-17]
MIRSRFGLALPALVGALIGVALATGLTMAWDAAQHRDSDLHQLLHKAAPLDPEEQAALDVKEKQFEAVRSQIEHRLQNANTQLADAIAKDPKWSPAVEVATREVEKAAGDLQRATLEHVFEMRAGLKPEHRAAYDAVLIKALRRGPR